MEPMTKRIFLAPCCLLALLVGCLEGSKFPLSDPNTDAIDKSLIGTWVCSSTDSCRVAEETTLTISTPSKDDGVPSGALIWKSKRTTNQKVADWYTKASFIICVPTSMADIDIFQLPRATTTGNQEPSETKQMSNYTASSSTGLETANLQPSSPRPRTNESRRP